MNDFVEQCRREWKRLRVPDAVADEMAAELEADLEDAQAEGASPAEVLGQGASDPKSFASAWASERGVGRSRGLGRRGALLLAALGAFATVAIAGAVLVTVAGSTASKTKLDLSSLPRRAPVEHTAAPAPAVWITQRTGDVVTVEVPGPRSRSELRRFGPRHAHPRSRTADRRARGGAAARSFRAVAKFQNRHTFALTPTVSDAAGVKRL